MMAVFQRKVWIYETDAANTEYLLMRRAIQKRYELLCAVEAQRRRYIAAGKELILEWWGDVR